jgi:hypothetical protein
MLDLKPVLTTLSKITDQRILPECVVTSEGDLHQATIPVAGTNPGDETDQAMRRYARDWVKKQGKYSVEVKFQKFKPSDKKVWQYDDGRETPIVGAIILTWWPQPELSDFEVLERMQRERRRH